MSRWTRWVRFNGVGLLGIGVQLSTLGLLVEVLRIDYRLATVFAVAAAVAHNFVWHLRWTWASRNRQDRTSVLLVRFAAANGLTSLFGNVVFMWLLVGQAGLPIVAANAAAIGLCGLLNFLLADNLVFRARAAAGDAPGAHRPLSRAAGPAPLL